MEDPNRDDERVEERDEPPEGSEEPRRSTRQVRDRADNRPDDTSRQDRDFDPSSRGDESGEMM